MRTELRWWCLLAGGCVGLLLWLRGQEPPAPRSPVAIRPELGDLNLGLDPRSWEVLTAVCADRRPAPAKAPRVVSVEEDVIVLEGEEDPGHMARAAIARTQYRRCLTLARRWAEASMGRDPRAWRLPKERCALEQARAKMWATAMQDHPKEDLVPVIAVHRARERNAFDAAVAEHSRCLASTAP